MSESETPATPSREERIEDYLKKREDINDKLSGGLPEEKFREAVKQYAEEAGKAGDEDFRLLFEAEVMFFEHRESGRDTSDMTAAIAKIEEALQWQEKNFAENDPCGAFYLTFHFWGRALHFQGDYSGAIEKYQEAVKIKPDDYQALHNWGVALANLGDYPGAIEKYEEALKIKPDFCEALINWGVALADLGDYSGAIEKYEEVLKIKPDDYQALVNWGNALRKLGDYSGAIEKYQEAWKIKPDDYQALNNWGFALCQTGQHISAIEKIRESLGINRDNSYAKNNYHSTILSLADTEIDKEDYLKHVMEAMDFIPEFMASEFVETCKKENNSTVLICLDTM